MSHAHTYGEFYVIQNGDYLGVEIYKRDVSGERVLVATLPMWLLEHIVTAKVRQERIAALEAAGPNEILGLKNKGPVYD